MKIKLLLTLFIISAIHAEINDSSEGFPGGYVGLSVQYGTNKTIGLQASFGVAVPGFGEPSMGPYLFQIGRAHV